MIKSLVTINNWNKKPWYLKKETRDFKLKIGIIYCEHDLSRNKFGDEEESSGWSMASDTLGNLMFKRDTLTT